MATTIIFYILAAIILICAVMSVTTKRIMRAATYLLFVLFATAVIYFQMDYAFLGAVQIAVYAGGIVVLFVFAILLTHQPGKDAQRIESTRRVLGAVAALLGVAVCGYGLFSYANFCHRQLAEVSDMNIETIGHWLLSTEKFGYLLPFEAVSVLLLACIIGGVVIARRR